MKTVILMEFSINKDIEDLEETKKAFKFMAEKMVVPLKYIDKKVKYTYQSEKNNVFHNPPYSAYCGNSYKLHKLVVVIYRDNYRVNL